MVVNPLPPILRLLMNRDLGQSAQWGIAFVRISAWFSLARSGGLPRRRASGTNSSLHNAVDSRLELNTVLVQVRAQRAQTSQLARLSRGKRHSEPAREVRSLMNRVWPESDSVRERSRPRRTQRESTRKLPERLTG